MFSFNNFSIGMSFYSDIIKSITPAGSVNSPNITEMLNQSNSLINYAFERQTNSRSINDNKTKLSGQAAAMRESLKDVLNKSGSSSVFSNSKVDSSSEAITGTMKDGTVSSGSVFSIEVKKMAQSQEILSDVVDSNSASTLSEGTHKFGVRSNGQDYELEIEISADDTMEDSLRKIADSLNVSGTGLSALVVDNDSDNAILTVQSNESGLQSGFTLNELDGESILSKTGLNNLSEVDYSTGKGGIALFAQDAMYRIDGGDWQTSSNNQISTQTGMQLTFNSITDGSATIKAGIDTDNIVSKVEDIITQFNSLSEYLYYNKNSNNQAAIQKLDNIVSNSLSEMKKMGISVEQGVLKVDSDELKQRLSRDPSSVERVFGSVGQFSKQLDLEMQNIIKGDPVTYSSPYGAVNTNQIKNSFNNYAIGMLVDQFI